MSPHKEVPAITHYRCVIDEVEVTVAFHFLHISIVIIAMIYTQKRQLPSIISASRSPAIIPVRWSHGSRSTSNDPDCNLGRSSKKCEGRLHIEKLELAGASIGSNVYKTRTRIICEHWLGWTPEERDRWETEVVERMY